MTTTHAIEPTDLDAPDAVDPAHVGSKAAGLARLRAAGFPVPDAVVLPVGLARAWPDGPAPDDLRGAIDRACATLGGPLAVRSSATWEDGATSAHAGATTTVLDVTGTDAVVDAVRACLDGTAAAQRELGLDGDVAVVLQRLVPAEWAGVAFTIDPLSGATDLVRIAATPGLAEALVQGEVTGADVAVRDGAIEGDAAGLPDEVTRAVADAARRVEEALGGPQDVEWAWADGALHLVQARPITVVPIEPALPEGNNWQKDTAHYPEPMTPFGWSLLHHAVGEVIAAFDEHGLLIRGLEEVFVGGEVYGRVVPAFGSPNSAAAPPPAAVLGVAARVVPALRRRTAAARRALEEDLPGRWVREWHDHDRAEVLAATRELAAVDLAELTDAELLGHLERCLALFRRGYRIHFRLIIPLAQAMFALNQLLATELGWDDARTNGLLGGHSPATRAAEDAMADLRRRVAETAGADDALRTEPGRPVAALGRVDASLGEALADWIAEHGWSLINYDAGVPTLAERPTLVTSIVLAAPAAADHRGVEADAAEARAALPPARRAEFDEVLAQARAIYPLREDNTIIVGDRPMAAIRRTMLELGERLAAAGVLAAPGDAAYLMLDELRAAASQVAAGTRPPGREAVALTQRRRGEEAWARANPGPAYVGEQGAPPDTSRLPEPLRRMNEPVLWIVGHEYPAPVEAPADDDVLLAGVPVSAGVVEGPVRVVRSHRDLHRLVDGEVLVCQVTTPAWSPVFPLARAVVADGGGVLSHAAIAAREHGLPAVLGTGDGTSVLRDGQRVRVDGTRGLVLAVDDA